MKTCFQETSALQKYREKLSSELTKKIETQQKHKRITHIKSKNIDQTRESEEKQSKVKRSKSSMNS